MDQNDLFLGVYICAATMAFSAGIGALRRRDVVAGAGPLVVVTFGLGCWSVFEALQVVVTTDWVRMIFIYLTMPAIGVVVAGFYLEAHALVDPDWRLSRRAVLALSIHPIAILIAAFTNSWHHRFVTSVELNARAPWVSWRPGILFWLYIGYCYLLVGRANTRLERRQLLSIVVAALLGVVADIVTLSRGGGQIMPDLTPAFVVLAGVVHYHAVFRRGLLRLLPVARGLVLENVSDAIFVTDTAGRLVDINRAGRQLARRLEPDLPPELIGLHVWRLLPPTGHRRTLTDGEYHVVRPDGELDLDMRISDLADRHSRPLGRVVVVRDITELNEQRRRLADVNTQLTDQLRIIDRLRHELAELAVRDDLTGLYNRRHLVRQLDAELDLARTGGGLLAVVLLDIDHFKSVNDRFGHAVGDELLVATGRALVDGVRTEDTVARYGGEEFVILLPGADLEDAVRTAELLRYRVAGVLVESRSGPVSTTASVGVATFPGCGWTGGELLQSADDALYAAKRSGRDRVVAAFSGGAGD